MKLGVPKEIKNREYRVGMTPETVAQVAAHGHHVVVETRAGEGVGATDADYRRAGAAIVKSAAAVFGEADMIVKVKEPLAAERKRLRRGQALFTYLHLAADKTLTRDLVSSGAACIAYEMVADSAGRLPLLAPMSKIAGRLAAQAAAHYLQRSVGGAGKLVGGAPGVLPAKIAIIGGGMVGRNAARIALGMGGDVTILERDDHVMDSLVAEFNGAARTLFSSPANIAAVAAESDALIGGVLSPGKSAPKLVTEDMVKSMRAGSVIVDVAIDQGGCVATAKPTTHDNPVYVKHGVTHYCVANMPGAVPHTAAHALNNVTAPFILALADKGWKRAVREDPRLQSGLSAAEGKLLCPHAAASLNMRRAPAESVLN